MLRGAASGDGVLGSRRRTATRAICRGSGKSEAAPKRARRRAVSFPFARRRDSRRLARDQKRRSVAASVRARAPRQIAQARGGHRVPRRVAPARILQHHARHPRGARVRCVAVGWRRERRARKRSRRLEERLLVLTRKTSLFIRRTRSRPSPETFLLGFFGFIAVAGVRARLFLLLLLLLLLVRGREERVGVIRERPGGRTRVGFRGGTPGTPGREHLLLLPRAPPSSSWPRRAPAARWRSTALPRKSAESSTVSYAEERVSPEAGAPKDAAIALGSRSSAARAAFASAGSTAGFVSGLEVFAAAPKNGSSAERRRTTPASGIRAGSRASPSASDPPRRRDFRLPDFRLPAVMSAGVATVIAVLVRALVVVVPPHDGVLGRALLARRRRRRRRSSSSSPPSSSPPSSSLSSSQSRASPAASSAASPSRGSRRRSRRPPVRRPGARRRRSCPPSARTGRRRRCPRRRTPPPTRRRGRRGARIAARFSRAPSRRSGLGLGRKAQGLQAFARPLTLDVTLAAMSAGVADATAVTPEIAAHRRASQQHGRLAQGGLAQLFPGERRVLGGGRRRRRPSHLSRVVFSRVVPVTAALATAARVRLGRRRRLFDAPLVRPAYASPFTTRSASCACTTAAVFSASARASRLARSDTRTGCAGTWTARLGRSSSEATSRRRTVGTRPLNAASQSASTSSDRPALTRGVIAKVD